MKKILLALGFTLIATSAQAITMGNLTLNTFGSTSFIGTNNVINATSGLFGQLAATQSTRLKFTFLGKEAANTNSLLLNGLVAAGSTTNTVSVGNSFLLNSNEGAVNFGFTGTGGVTTSNTIQPDGNIAFIENVDSLKDADGNVFAFLAGFNDGGSEDADFDDFVVGINEVSAVPAPAAAWLFGSALMGFVSFRRKSI